MTQHILITGANRGIGLEFVRQYLPSGAHILACCRNPELAESLKQLSDTSNGRISIHGLDVADFEAIENLADELRELPIDLLINNAGVYGGRDNDFGTVKYDEWMDTFRINTMAPLKMAESFVHHLSRGNRPILSTITSKMGSVADNTSGGSYVYRTSKTAVNMVTKCLSLDLMPHKIRCVALHPGWVETDMGGPDALISVRESVEGMRKILSNLTDAQNGAFLAYDGQVIPW